MPPSSRPQAWLVLMIRFLRVRCLMVSGVSSGSPEWLVVEEVASDDWIALISDQSSILESSSARPKRSASASCRLMEWQSDFDDEGRREHQAARGVPRIHAGREHQGGGASARRVATRDQPAH